MDLYGNYGFSYEKISFRRTQRFANTYKKYSSMKILYISKKLYQSTKFYYRTIQTHIIRQLFILLL